LIAYLGLGSNVGDRRANLMAAAEAVGARRMSSIYETAPQGEVLDQPDFLNAVVEIETELGPEELLVRCKEIESEMGRRAGGVRHGPRPIDVDILLLGDTEYESERLRIPHRDLETRRFVLEPLRELAPDRVDEARLAAVQDQRVQRLP
jgi:2-amino-4-hydroxy-6-hydroxymethyldihydropteridine diphosphokinase